MLKIGDFSKLSLVSVKTLRHYDELGLLKPAFVDHFTGYRYYTAAQLGRLNRILALKDLGLSLEEIGILLQEDLSVEQIRGMLRLRQAEAQSHLQALQAQIQRVEARLRQLEEEGVKPMYDVVLKTVPAQRVAYLRRVLPTYAGVGELFGELFAYLNRLEVRPDGPTILIMHDPECRDEDVDVEVAIPVATAVPSGTPLADRVLPQVQVACVVYQGSYEGIGAAYNAVMAWLEPNGYKIAAPCRENYLISPGDTTDPAQFVTEIQVPVEKAS
ncbi:MAG TPA: MerR family transcriptional regulator [Firmicutes bacterium]|nr:MerR family transcriptional regulator [Bacillota bacterium]